MSITKKISPFDKPGIGYKFSKMALQTNSVNLGQGFPDWKSPDFYYEALSRNMLSENANHQYTRSFGNMKLVNEISKNYKKYLKREIDPINEILVSTGSVSVLHS